MTPNHLPGNPIQQEILVFTSTSFAKTLLGAGDPSRQIEKGFSGTSRLAQACKEGLIFETILELTNLPFWNQDLFLWEVLAAEHYVWISQGTLPIQYDPSFSLDPYFRLLTMSLN